MTIYCRWMLVFVFSAVLLCTSVSAKTKLVQSWADPSAKGYTFSKVLAMVVLDNEEMRRVAETAVVSNIKKVKAIPAYKVLTNGEERDVERAKVKLREEGFDSAVVLRVFDVDNKVQYVAAHVPDPYTSYWSYNSYVWPITGTPGYVKHDRIIQLEMLFFSIKNDKLLWAGVVESSNPEDAVKLIDNVAKVISQELQKKGIVK